MESHWGADTPISLPVPPDHPPLVDLGGFAFTAGGIAHHVTKADVEEISIPPFAPPMDIPMVPGAHREPR